MRSRIGKRVKIVGGMKEFVGQTGTIIEQAKLGHYEPITYRVRLDKPVHVENVGMVDSDLWQACYLKVLRGE